MKDKGKGKNYHESREEEREEVVIVVTWNGKENRVNRLSSEDFKS